MKKSKKVISYILLLVPLALPAACSPINQKNKYNSPDRSLHYDLKSVVDSYFNQKDEVPVIRLVPVESEQEKEEELAALEKTGDWNSEDANNNLITVQCVLPKAMQLNNTLNPIKIKPLKKEVCGFPVTRNKQVDFYLDQFRNKQRNTFKTWLERSARYLPYINKELEKAGLPKELGYLAMIESGFNPSAYSRSHASGLWQFMPGTGRDYGLQVNSWIDERRDPEKATKAAISYLKSLYRRFGDWQLAVAAYNGGEGKIEQGLRKYKAKNFWELARHKYLHLETKRYVPKLIAAILLAREQEKYGFTNLKWDKPISYDLVKVPSRTHLGAVATSASLSVKKLRELNNDLLRDQVPAAKNGYLLKVPAGSSRLVKANLRRVHPVSRTSYVTHKVRRNETLKAISRRYKLSMTSLLKANNLRSSKLKRGQRLRIPSSGEKYVLLQKGQSVDQYYTAHGSKTLVHRLAKGETLSKVSQTYKVPVKMIMSWNGIRDARRVKAGSRLTIYPLQSTGQGATGAVELIAASKKRKPGVKEQIVRSIPLEKPAAEAVITLSEQKKRQPNAAVHPVVSYYRVRNGDSLWSIARKLQVSTREIKRWNSLPNSLLHPGTTLVIKNT